LALRICHGGGSVPRSPDSGLGQCVLLATQSVVAAAVMAAALRIERTAEAAFTDLESAETTAALERSRREEEQAQLRLIHNGPLMTLAAALHADPPATATVLRKRAAAALEALENVVRHAGTDRAEVRLREHAELVTVTIADQGRGFELTHTANGAFGLREDLVGRMEASGGSAIVESKPGAGTVVRLAWRRD
jgi:signal transduction histidine kinase